MIETTTRETTPKKPDSLESIPEMGREDAALHGAIEVIRDYGWTNKGWGDLESGVCILNAVNVAITGKPRRTVRYIPKSVLVRIHRVLWPHLEIKGRHKEALASSIMSWNDCGYAKNEGGKLRVLHVLREAFKRR